MKINTTLLLIVVLLISNVNLLSQTAEEWKKLGNVQLDSANYLKAIEYYQKAVEVDNDYFDAYYNLGSSYFFLLEYDKAIEYYNIALSKDSTDVDPYIALGAIYTENQDYHKAIEYYERAIEVDSSSFGAYYSLGVSYYSLLEYDKAIEYLKEAITKNETEAVSFFVLGRVYAEKQDYDKAIEMVKQGIGIEPESPEELYFLGFLYQEMGSFIYSTMYAKKAAQMGDTLAQQYFISEGIPWEDDFLKPDYEQIRSTIEDSQSIFYYSKLWDRFHEGDSTMTLDELRHLYYGYTFNPNYSPYSSAYDAEQANAILNKKKPTKKEWKKLISLLDISLAAEPFNCRYLYYQSIAYNALKRQEEADKNLRKIQLITDALISSGDGLSKESAIHVIAVSSEYDYLFVNNFSAKSQSLIYGSYDVLYLNSNEAGLEELWFDISQPFGRLK